MATIHGRKVGRSSGVGMVWWVPARTTCHIIGNSHYMLHRVWYGVTAALRTVVDLLLVQTLRRLHAAVVSRRCAGNWCEHC